MVPFPPHIIEILAGLLVLQPMAADCEARSSRGCEAAADLYSLVHREAGPGQTFLTFDEAERARVAVLHDEPGWADDLWIEPFWLRVVAEHNKSSPA